MNETPIEGRPLRVLVIDDDVDGAASLGILLDMSGCVSVYATSGAEGIASAADFDPDLAIVDLEMPRMDGREVVGHLRAAGSRAKLVCLTAHRDPSDRQTCLAAGFDDFFTKPLRADTLSALLSSARRDAVAR